MVRFSLQFPVGVLEFDPKNPEIFLAELHSRSEAVTEEGTVRLIDLLSSEEQRVVWSFYEQQLEKVRRVLRQTFRSEFAEALQKQLDEYNRERLDELSEEHKRLQEARRKGGRTSRKGRIKPIEEAATTLAKHNPNLTARQAWQWVCDVADDYLLSVRDERTRLYHWDSDRSIGFQTFRGYWADAKSGVRSS